MLIGWPRWRRERELAKPDEPQQLLQLWWPLSRPCPQLFLGPIPFRRSPSQVLDFRHLSSSGMLRFIINLSFDALFAALPIVEIPDEEAEILPQARTSAESNRSTETGEGLSLRRRKRQRGEGSSRSQDAGPSRPSEVILPPPSEVPHLSPLRHQDQTLVNFQLKTLLWSFPQPDV